MKPSSSKLKSLTLPTFEQSCSSAINVNPSKKARSTEVERKGAGLFMCAFSLLLYGLRAFLPPVHSSGLLQAELKLMTFT